MTETDIKKNKFVELASKCFDEKTLGEVELKIIYKRKEEKSY